MREWESWAKVIRSGTELPEAFRDCVPVEKTFPYTVYAPEYCGRGPDENPKLICLYPDCVTIFEQAASRQITCTRHSFDSIERIVHGKIFLYSWIEFHGLAAGHGKTSKIIYNTVSEGALLPIILEARRSMAGSRSSDKGNAPPEAKFEFLHDINLKFYRSAPMTVLSGGTVRRVLYQPELRAHILGFIPYTLLPNQIVILTDEEIISMRDGGWTKSEGGARDSYGAVRSFIPLGAVRDAAIADPRRSELKQLSITLPHEEVCLSFDSRFEQELSIFQGALLEGARTVSASRA